MAVAAALTVVTVVGVGAAFANAPNPNPDTTGTATVNNDGTVTAVVQGTWAWPGQNCEGRYGEGWAVDWWGISTSSTPNPSFQLTDATEVTSPGVTTTGTISPAGAIAIQKTGTYFHVAQYYGGETVNSASTCTDTSTKPPGSTGSWSATATYPSMADVPSQVCVNMYDEHGKEGQPSKNPSDFSPVNDNDNSIQTNSFNPGDGYCVALQVTQQPGYVEICENARGVTGDFTFNFAGMSQVVPVNACGPPTQVPSGTLTIVQVRRPFAKLTNVKIQPRRNTVSVDLETRTAVVTIVPGGLSAQTIVTWTNVHEVPEGILKACVVAGTGITVGTKFTFTSPRHFTIPAGPAPGGYCHDLGYFNFGDKTFTQTIPTGDQVSAITVVPSKREVGPPNLATGTVVVKVGGGVTEATYTDATA